MISANNTVSLLEQLENAGVKVDVDSFVPEIAKSLPFTPHDATSNQALIGLCVYDPKQFHVVRDTVESMPGSSPLDVLTVLHAKFGRAQLDNISGRVLVQSSPSFPNDEQKIIDHGRAYARALQVEGVPLNRLAIKIPTTSAGMRAARELKKEGIESLGTTLFSVPQAIAASQAGTYAISPYFNPCLAHDDSSLFVDVADPAAEHPMANRMIHIRQTYDRLAEETGGSQPQIKGAGFITAREVMAQLELGCDNVTVLPASIEDLLACHEMPTHAAGEWSRRWRTQLDQTDLRWGQWPVSSNDNAARRAKLASADPLAGSETAKFEPASTEIDYLAEGVLDDFNEKDEATKFRLANAIETFRRGEEKLLDFIKSIQEQGL